MNRYSKYATLLAIALCIIAPYARLHAQSAVPGRINYQAVARDAAGAILSKQTIGVRMTIHRDAANGAVEYQETFWLQTNQFGLFSVLIGGGDRVQGSMDAVAWGSAPHYLQVEMDPAGGTNYLDMGTTELVSVPYALHARTAETALNAGSGGKVDTAVVAQTLQLPVDLRSNTHTGGTMLNVSTEDSTFVTAIAGWAVGKGQNVGVYGKSEGRTSFASGVLGEGVYVGVRGVVGAGGPLPEREVFGVHGINFSSQDYSTGVTGSANNDSGLAYGVYGRIDTKTRGSAGVFGLGRMTGTYGVHGRAEQAGESAGVYAESDAQDEKGTALLIRGGHLRVGGGLPAFVHTVEAANKINGAHTTELTYRGMENTDILIITRVSQTGAPSSFSLKLVADKWNIFLDDDTKTLAEGDRFNVLVIKQ